MDQPRFAIYYAPAASHVLASVGDTWLGRAAITPNLQACLTQTNVGVDSLRAFTQHPRRYGFHATLKAPFHLADGCSVDALLQAVEHFSQTQASILLPKLEVSKIDNFLALVPSGFSRELDTLARRCVSEFDSFRRPLTEAQIASRRRKPLTKREDEMLLRWGYPSVFDCYRFHMTLTDSMDGVHGDFSKRIEEAARLAFPSALLRDTSVDAISVFEEPRAGADFRLILRAPFGKQGRLVYIVGPSGVGKDSLLKWAQRALEHDTRFSFARRVITRASDGGDEETHEPITEAAFNALSAAGHLAMSWEAHGLMYGIRTEIDDALRRGKTVIVNGSREHLPIAAERYPNMEVVSISAPSVLIETRLRQRGRETATEIAARQQRGGARPVALPVALEISNTGTIAEAGAVLLQFLRLPQTSQSSQPNQRELAQQTTRQAARSLAS
jgi:phosphonate metabolism protein PhnN/1,5-bisphosphokinase (PRPP-forming)